MLQRWVSVHGTAWISPRCSQTTDVKSSQDTNIVRHTTTVRSWRASDPPRCPGTPDCTVGTGTTGLSVLRSIMQRLLHGSWYYAKRQHEYTRELRNRPAHSSNSSQNPPPHPRERNLHIPIYSPIAPLCSLVFSCGSDLLFALNQPGCRTHTVLVVAWRSSGSHRIQVLRFHCACWCPPLHLRLLSQRR